MTQTQATKRPWECEMTFEHPQGGTFSSWIRNCGNDDVLNRLAKVEGLTEQEVEANAHLIVKCVNSHDELLEALKYALEMAKQGAIPNYDDSWYIEAEQALKKASQ